MLVNSDKSATQKLHDLQRKSSSRVYRLRSHHSASPSHSLDVCITPRLVWTDENVCISAIYLPAGPAGRSDAVAAGWGSFVIDCVIFCKPDSPLRP